MFAKTASGVGLYDAEGLSRRRRESIERDPQDSIGCSQLWPLYAALESRELVSEGEVLQK